MREEENRAPKPRRRNPSAVGNKEGLWEGDGGDRYSGQCRQGRCELRENGRTLSVPFFLVQTGVSPSGGGFAPGGMARKGALKLAAVSSLLASNNLFPLSKDGTG